MDVARMTRRPTWPALTLTLLALLGVLTTLVVTGTRSAPAVRFTVTPGPSLVTLTGGTSARVAVTVTPRAGFSGEVRLATTELPPGLTVRLDRPTVVLGTGRPSAATTALLTATSSVVPGAVGVGITARSGRSVSTGVLQVRLQPAGITDPPVPSGVGVGSTSFSVSGRPAGVLVPGAALPIDLQLANPNAEALRVQQLSVRIVSTSSAGCAPGNFAVTGYSGQYPLLLPGRAYRSLSSLGVPPERRPHLRMLNLATNQDGCKGVRIGLAYAGTGSPG